MDDIFKLITEVGSVARTLITFLGILIGSYLQFSIDINLISDLKYDSY